MLVWRQVLDQNERLLQTALTSDGGLFIFRDQGIIEMVLLQVWPQCLHLAMIN